MPKALRSERHRKLVHLLVEARKSAGMTQADLATSLNRPQSFVAKYEGGERRIDLIEFIEIAEALETDPEQIVRSLK